MSDQGPKETSPGGSEGHSRPRAVEHGSLEGKVVANRYVVGQRLGEGGLWVVYLGNDLASGQPVAIKVMREDVAAEPEASTRFLKQAEDAFKLNHANIVRVLATGTEDDRHFLITEYVDGKNIRQWFMEEGRSWSELSERLKAICQALSYAHSLGIFHRSIKPENLFIDRNGILKITDFGFARRLEGQTRLTSGGHENVVAYITPEQAKGQRGDARSDLYSLGVVLYELSTGKLPFWAPDPVRIVFKHINELPVRPRQVNPKVPPWVEHITLRLLEKDPGQRFQSVKDVFDELTRAERSGTGEFIELDATDFAQARRLTGYAPLVGRESVEKELRELLNHASRGDGAVALVSGAPGIGKTRLVNELATYGRLMGFVALRGTAAKRVRMIFSPFLEIVREYLRKNDLKLRDMLPDDAGLLEGFMEGRADEFLNGDPTAFLNRYQEIFLQFLERAGDSRALLLVIEDIGALDEPSLHLIREIAQKTPKSRTLLVLTCRTDAITEGSVAHRLVQDLKASPNTHGISLEPLDIEQTALLACHLAGAQQLNEDLAEALIEASEGNPLHIEDSLAMLVRERVLEVKEGLLDCTSFEKVRAMNGLMRLFEKRIASLPQNVAMVLTVASCIGASFDFEVLMKVSGKPQDEIVSILQWAERNNLIEEEWFPGRERFRFRHDVIQDVLYRSLDTRSRKRLHLLVGGAIEESFAPRLRDVYEALTFHYRESDQWEKAVEYSTRAGERFFLLKAHEAAQFYYANALELADMLEDGGDRRLHCLKRSSAVLKAMGDEDGARRFAEQALALARERRDAAEEREIQEILAG
ncbi:MAG: hypothetical protein FJX76_11780 [Armatimonadetes bacterium]|nr:hypothetical protein [Armatimonadota bacterium]